MSGPGIPDSARADFDAFLAGAHQDAAAELATGLVAGGVSAEEVLLGLVAPAQVKVGERWASGTWTVAREHAATLVSMRTVDAVAAAARARADAAATADADATATATATAEEAGGPAASAPRGDVLVACSDGEWHVLPSHILAEVLRLRGFRVRSLGGHVSPQGLLSDVHQNGPDVVALSCTLSENLPRAHRQIETCRSAGVPVMTGGAGFGPDGAWGYALGADLYAADAREAARALLEDWPPELRGESSVEAGAVEAYATLVRRRPALLEDVARACPEVVAGLRGRTGDDLDEGEEFLGRLLNCLAAAVFIGDARVFTGQLDFAARYLTARSVDAGCLGAVADALAERLRGSPRAVAMATAGGRWLGAREHGPRRPR